MNGYVLVFYVEIKSCKVEVDQEASETSWMELFTAEVSGWKLLTIDVEGFVSDVTWYLDLSLNKYYYVS